MPIANYPAAVVKQLLRPDGLAPITLVDLQLQDGSIYFFSDLAGLFPGKLTAGMQTYIPRVKRVGPFQTTRSMLTDAGDLVFENISGNSIYRNTALAVSLKEFESAFAIVRIYSDPAEQPVWEFHGKVTEVAIDDAEGVFRVTQLTDASDQDAPADIYSESCTWRYKSAQCGSTGSALVCDKTFCGNDPTRNAGERFNGCPNPPPQNPQIVGPAYGGGSGGGRGPGDGGGGPRNPRMPVAE